MNFSEWYAKVVREADIIDDRYPVKGMPVYKPYGFKFVKNILQKLSEFLDKEGFEEAWFPVVIPYEIFKKESEHIRGFEEEVFWVMKSEEEKLILRPTSETEMYYMFSLWIQSYQDLPLKLYMNNTVYRAETKATKPLIRGREILWNEAHTAHRNLIDAEKMIKKAIEIYSKVFWDINHVPHIWVIRPEWDKFAGAEITYAADTVLPDGRFLQIGTVHLLGQKFARAFEIKFQDSHPFVQTLDKNIFIAKTKDGKEIKFEIKDDKIYVKFEGKELIFDKEFEGEISEENEKLIENLYKIIEKLGLKKEDLDVWKYVWQTSFGISMRFAAAVISILGDDLGLVLPFETAPIQIVIVPIWYNEEQKEKVLNKAKEIYEILKEKYRVYLDDREDKTPGWKFYYWEFKGVPLRIEIGPKDLENNTVVIAVRITGERSVKYKINIDELLVKLEEIIREREMKLKEKAKKYFEEKIVKAETLDELKKAVEEGKVVKAPFCMREECAKQLKEYLHVEVRGTDLNPEEAKGKRCIYCGEEAKYWVYIGKTY